MDRWIGYEYLTLSRSLEREDFTKLLHLWEEMLLKEEDLQFYKHCKKWTSVTMTDYPVSRLSYHTEHMSSFPFPFVDDFWFAGSGRPSPFVPTDIVNEYRFTNDTDIDIPSTVLEILNKGPKFRVPPKLNNNFLEDAKLQLEVLTYKLRWKSVFSDNIDNDNSDKLVVPFQKNSVRLPPKMMKEDEANLACFKHEVVRTLRQEVKATARSNDYKKCHSQISELRNFLEKNNLICVPSDKTNRLVIVDKMSFRSKTRNILEDSDTYKNVPTSKSKAIEKQANKLLKNIRDKDHRLLSNGSHPANFRTLVKDHKAKEIDGFPLRPIASCRETPTEKIDWLVSKVIGQLVQFVPAHLKNTFDLMKLLDNLDECNADQVFVSLDVKNLYPSIPIQYGIESVTTLAKKHWDEISHFGFKLEDLTRCLTFLSYNYEIKYLDQIYLQICGCPMGAHFSPPFAIITMNRIENEALTKLKNTSIVPLVYKRYIDDIIIGPITHEENTFKKIIETFNSINPSIQFTIDIPDRGDSLKFLDIEIYIDKNGLHYEWYRKELCSNNTLRKDSWLPEHVKVNFIKNMTKQAVSRCSDSTLEKNALSKLNKIFHINGHQSQVTKHEFKLNYNNNVSDPSGKSCFLLGFVSDSCDRKIKQLIKKYDVPVSLISRPNKYLSQCFNDSVPHNKHDNCDICNLLLDKFTCEDKYVVYEFKCKLCENSYIGQTCRPFQQRYKEHRHSVEVKNKNSALSEHILISHPFANPSMNNFTCSILKKLRNPVETKITESVLNDRLKPTLNRREEMARW